MSTSSLPTGAGRVLSSSGRGASHLRASAALFLALLVVGCASMPPDRVALNTLETIKATAESAMRVHADLYNKGLTGPTQADRDARRAKVDRAYEVVRSSCTAAALTLQAVKTWGDMVTVLAVPQANLNALTKLVPEYQPPKEKK